MLEEIGGVIAKKPLTEKWLIAPNRRIGFSWLDSITRAGIAVLNVHVKTIDHLALEIAGAEMERRGLTFLRRIRQDIFIEGIFRKLKVTSKSYLAGMEVDSGLVACLKSMLNDLRMSGVCAAQLAADSFEVTEKGREVGALLGMYENGLKKMALADRAVIFSIARDLLEGGVALPKNVVLLLPEKAQNDLRALEAEMISKIPGDNLRIVRADPGPVAAQVRDIELLRLLGKPESAPVPAGDGSVKIFRAVGETNEIREILRRVTEAGTPFDDVEIVYTDSATYLPLIYEHGAGLVERHADIPFTFAEGIPVTFAKPARALLAWLEWTREDLPQTIMVDMIREGLLEIPSADEDRVAYSHLAAVLRSVPVYGGRGRYLKTLERALADAAADPSDPDDDDGVRRGRSDKRALEILTAYFPSLLDATPFPGVTPAEFVEKALEFLEKHTRATNELDTYTRRRLVEELEELRDCLELGLDTSLNLREWVQRLAGTTHVGGLGPRPGRIFVTPITSAGHSGRKNVFIVGLDDARFPGAGLQDPLLLDTERTRIDARLPTSGTRLAKRISDIGELFGRLAGNVTLCYPAIGLIDDREMFPSSVLLAAYRIVSGQHAADQADLEAAIGPPVSFAPAARAHALDVSEWWLARLTETPAPGNAMDAVCEYYPHLGQGRRAEAARNGPEFTAYDGYVPEAGRDHDPTLAGGRVLSAHGLETIGRCPLEYFFRYVLDIEPLEEYVIDPSAWLDALGRGALLHETFYRFMTELRAAGLRPDGERDRARIFAIVENEIEKYGERFPPPNDDLRRRRTAELKRAALIFLEDEAAHCERFTPRFFEVSIGMTGGETVSPLDSAEPVAVTLDDASAFRARGRIDRIDEVGEAAGRFVIWDYKTGSAKRFDERDPFSGGRHIQNALYFRLAEERLRKMVDKKSAVVEFGYFFPVEKSRGKRIRWTSDRLAVDGRRTMSLLIEMIRKGCFPFSNSAADARFSKYGPAFGNPERTGENVRAKLLAEGSAALAPFAVLRAAELAEERP